MWCPAQPDNSNRRRRRHQNFYLLSSISSLKKRRRRRLFFLNPILENRSTALVKLSMVLSASPCWMPSRTQCRIWPSSTTWPHLCRADLAALIWAEHVLAGHVLVDHAVDGLDLADDLFPGGGAGCPRPYTVSWAHLPYPVGYGYIIRQRPPFVKRRRHRGAAGPPHTPAGRGPRMVAAQAARI